MPPTIAEMTAMEVRGALDRQEAVLSDIRSRATLVFTLAGLSSSFLAHPALAPHEGVPVLAWVALALLFGSAAAGTAVLWPWRRFRFAPSPTDLVSEAWASLTVDDFRQHLTTFAADAWSANGRTIRTLWWLVQLSMCLALGSIVAWIALLAKGA